MASISVGFLGIMLLEPRCWSFGICRTLWMVSTCRQNMFDWWPFPEQYVCALYLIVTSWLQHKLRCCFGCSFTGIVTAVQNELQWREMSEWKLILKGSIWMLFDNWCSKQLGAFRFSQNLLLSYSLLSKDKLKMLKSYSCLCIGFKKFG